jgi:hypothetical protein
MSAPKKEVLFAGKDRNQNKNRENQIKGSKTAPLLREWSGRRAGGFRPPSLKKEAFWGYAVCPYASLRPSIVAFVGAFEAEVTAGPSALNARKAAAPMTITATINRVMVVGNNICASLLHILLLTLYMLKSCHIN